MNNAMMVPDDDSTALMPMSMGGTFSAYKSMQTEIDKAMPDQIMTISGRQFRKKGYWRAVRAAFGLKVWCVNEERITVGDDWGYSVLYRAELRNGMSADGDGVCMASEKAERQRSVHNVRSHGHTRAFNRAVSNLVGFGEVSAEEMVRDEGTIEAHVVKATPPPAAKPVSPNDDQLFDDEPPADFDDGPTDPRATRITKLSSRDGEKNGKSWTQHFITLSDGAEGSFFDGQLAVAAQAAYAAKVPVIATWEQKGKYKNLVGLLRAD